MKQWLLTCSVDAIDVDYFEIIESDEEPGHWECDEIAQEHGCDWWYLEELEENFA